jgi:hypothetical protein
MMPTWRAEYFEERDSKEAVRSELIEAKDETEAADKAAEMGATMRVDVTRTILKNSN